MPNGNTNTGNNGTQENQNEATNIPQTENINTTFLTEFRNYVKAKDEKDQIPFYNKLLDARGGNLGPSLLEELNRFKNEKDESRAKYSSIDFSTISLESLKREFLKARDDNLPKLLTGRKVFKNKILDEFEINESSYNQNILPHVKKLTASKFIDLNKNKKRRFDFLKELLGANIPTQKVKFASASYGAYELPVKKAIDKVIKSSQIDEKKKEEFQRILASFDARDKSRGLDGDLTVALSELLELGVLDISFVKNVIKNYLPFISLEEALKEDLLTKERIKAYVLEYFQKNDIEIEDEYKEGNNIKDEKLNQIISDYKLSSIIQVNTEKDLLNDSEKVKKLLKNYSGSIAENIAEDWNMDFNNVEAKYNRDGPQSFEKLKEELKSINNNNNNRFTGLDDKFGVGCVIEVEKTGEVVYFEVKKINDVSKNLTLVEVGRGGIINLSGKEEGTNNSYRDFLDVFKNGGFKASFYSKSDIEGKIERLELKRSDLKLYNSEDIKEDRGELKEKYKKLKEKELEKLKNKQKSEQEELERLKKEQKELKKQDSKEKLEELKNKQKKLEDSINDPILNGNIERLENELKDINENLESVSKKDMLDFLNFESLLEKIDELNKEGKEFGLEKGIFLETKKGRAYEIVGIDDGFIRVRGDYSGEESIPYEDFYQVFKENKIKRIGKINDFQTLMDLFKDNDYWSDYEFKDGKVKKKELEEGIDRQDVEYFVSDKDNDIIKIEKIDGDKVTIKFGERKNRGDLDKEKYKSLYVDKNKDRESSEKAKEEVLFLESKTYTVSLNEFKKILDDKRKDYKPSLETGKTKKIKPKDSENKIKGSFFTRYLSGITFGDIFTGGKMLVDGIEAYLKKGNDLRAAKLALKLGKFLPGELPSEMQIKVEREEAEAMDKALEDLKKIDSWVAAQRIEKWLLNRNTPEYKKEAGLLFMYENYGHLTAKRALTKYAGKFLWYEAFGGRIGDKLYNEEKKKAEKDGIPFSEENLMYWLIREQCSGKGYNGIKRRTRLYKDVEGKWQNGIKNDYEKGQKDADGKRMAKDRVEGGMKELYGGTISNGIGWFEQAVGRGDSLEVMSEGFFCMLFSGTLYNVDQKTTELIKALWDGKGLPIIMIRFSTVVNEMKLFNKTVVELSKEFEKVDKNKYDGMAKEAEKLYNDALPPLTGKNTRNELLDRTQKFWKKYGKPLSRALHMVHSDDTEFAKTDKTVILKKDENPIINSYYGKVRGFTSGAGNAFHKDFMEYDAGSAGVSGLNTNAIIKKYLAQDTGGIKDVKVGAKMWELISKDVDSVPEKAFSDNPEEDKRLKTKYLIYILRDIISGFLSIHGPRPRTLESINTTGETGVSFKKWGLDITKFGTSSDLVEGGKYDDLLKKVAGNILFGKASGTNGNPLDSLRGETERRVRETTSNSEDDLDMAA